MTNKTIKMIVGAGCAVMGLFCACDVGAKTVIWDETRTTGVWEVGGAGWVDQATGLATTFAENDNVILSNAVGDVTLTLKGNFAVGDFLFNSTKKFTLTPTSRTEASTLETIDGSITDATSFTKLGTGNLVFANFTSSWKCDMDFLKGTMSVSNTKRAPGLDIVSSILGDLSTERTITIGCGDTNSIPIVKMEPWTTPQYLLTVKEEDFAAPLNFILDAGKLGSMERADSLIVSRPFIMRNGSQADEQVWFRHSLHIQRGADDQASPASTLYACRIAFNHNFGTIDDEEPFPVIVDDVTSENPGVVDGKTDFICNNYFVDYSLNGAKTRNSFVKRGKGRMEMKCNNSSFTGDIIIEDGVLYTATQAQGSNIKNYGTLGNSYTNRQIVVCSNAVLYLNRAECLAKVGNETPTLTMVLTNNATLKIVGYNTFGNMRIYGKPKFDFTSPTNGKQSFGFSENTYVKTDDCLVMRPGNMNTESGYFACLDHRFEKEKINDVTYGYSNLCIDRIVNSESNFIDMMLDYIVYDHMNNTVCGIVKTGNGVLALNRANAYRNRTLVREGGLWLGRTTGSKTGSVVSNVVVSSGAFVGGVGTMKRDLTIEEGGGFMVDATNRTARLTVNGTLTLPTAGLIKLYNVAERDVSKIKMDNLPLPSCATISGLNNLNAPAWKVQVDGLTPRETRNLKVTFNLGAAEGPSYSIAAQTGGLMVIVR